VLNNYTLWLTSKIDNGSVNNYIFLLTELNKIEYYFIDPLDASRVRDAISYRDEFARLNGNNDIYGIMPGSCTALELLVSMSERADFTMYDTNLGKRTPQWFWLFIKNLGLDYLSNDNWSFEAPNFIHITINKWFDRRFSPNGIGSPFPILDTKADLTTVSFWDAMQWYLANNSEVL